MPDLTAKQDENLRKIAAAQDAEEARYPRFPGFQGRAIAEILWPNSPAWERVTHSRPGFNGSRGGTMPMLGARRARELADLGMLSISNTAHHLPQFRVSAKGRKYLEENSNA